MMKKNISGVFQNAFSFLFRVICICLLMVETAAAVEQQEHEKSGREYILGAGDVIEVLVFGEPELSKIVTIRMDGRISLPLVGEFKAEGSTPALLSEQISEKVQTYVEGAHVSVILAESHSKVYYILGQVNASGEYAMNQPITVIQAIARAGGLLEWAKTSRILVVGKPDQPGKPTMFDYEAFLNRADTVENVVIHPGDTIIVP